MFLTPPDLLRLTGRRRYAAQRRALDRLGIRYLTALTGEPPGHCQRRGPAAPRNCRPPYG